MKIKLLMRPKGSNIPWDTRGENSELQTLFEAEHTDKDFTTKLAEAYKQRRRGVELQEYPLRHAVLRTRSTASENWRPLLALPYNDPDLSDRISAAKASAIRTALAEGRASPQFDERIELDGKPIEEVA